MANVSCSRHTGIFLNEVQENIQYLLKVTIEIKLIKQLWLI